MLRQSTTCARRAQPRTFTPGAKASATIVCFCSRLQARRRSGPVITSTFAIAPSLAPLQITSLAPVLSRYPTRARYRAVCGPHRTSLGRALAPWPSVGVAATQSSIAWVIPAGMKRDIGTGAKPPLNRRSESEKRRGRMPFACQTALAITPAEPVISISPTPLTRSCGK